MFKEVFKFYKTKSSVPDFSDVLDFETMSPDDERIKKKEILNESEVNVLGLKPIREWQCYELTNRPGLIFIKNPFTNKGQRYWLARCIRDYPKSPNIVNLIPTNFEKHEIEDWWKALQNCKHDNHRKNLKNSMRWTTLGYHHDWDTKIYSEEMKNKFPTDLANLSSYFAKILKFKTRYSAEAAIVNYYPIGTTLSGHTDHSEADLEAPLFSFSFGQTAIFLIGGPTKEEKPTAIFLKSGDVTVMSKKSRLCYHAVPRVMKSTNELWNCVDYEDNTLNNSNFNNSGSPNYKKLKIENEIDNLSIDMQLWKECTDKEFWAPFDVYLSDSRININVRQVLKEGQDKL